MRPQRPTSPIKSNQLSQIVSDYIANKRTKAEAERRWFIIQPTLEQAVSTAARARKPSGKRFGHQRRIPESVLRQSEKALLDAMPNLQSAKTFEELHHIISREIGDIQGIGELTIYDTALRIGAKLNLNPAVVFLHAGTRSGAKALGVDGSRRFIERGCLPREFSPLTPAEIEDVLCIYKDRLVKRTNTRVRDCN
jgi:hypothetical protein